ncbi:conserved hypothetical protein [Paecilomyces variotii No. 5]|uniref:Uncharacterized protein n=1 Tax=Byssochlamys spectabilis (strain No. 5 / NBRC 109023) TaxID=1356009 RepID=V5FL21_BYSSN|nr:conserved hypothetical protein [Paecilomyces variotii No. 5]
MAATHRRHPSSLDLSASSHNAYATNGYGQSPPLSPRTPRSSAPASPVTPRQQGSQAMNGSHRMSVDFTAAEAGGGLGSLADELADAWEEEEGGYEDTAGLENGQIDSHNEDYSDREETYIDSGAGTPGDRLSPDDMLQPNRGRPKNTHSRHKRHESQYDGSDYGNDSDLEEAPEISPSLEARMAGIESLARRGTEDNGSENDKVIKRAIESLRDLGGQSGIENGASRLITAHTSITSHLTHQTRTLQTLTHPLLFSPFPILSEEDIDSLVPLIDEELLPNLPYPFPQGQAHSRPTTPAQSASLNPLVSLQTLLSQTSELIYNLRGLSDTLHESRQLTSTASRRLRSAKELVTELKREEEEREEGTRWIEKGQWDRRLREREAGKVCGDVVSGFEAVCGEWRKRLFGVAAPDAVAA